MRKSVCVIWILSLLAACGSDDKKALDVSVPEGRADLPLDTAGADSGGDAAAMDVPADVALPVPATATLTDAQGNRVEVDTAPLAIRLYRGDDLIWDGGDSPVLLGRVEDYDPERRYDPELVPAQVGWYAPEDAVAYAETEDGFRLTFEPMPGRRVGLEAAVTGAGIVRFDVVPEAVDGEVLVRLGWNALDDDENFYGLGESFDHVARRGTRRLMHMTIDFDQESGYNEAHFPIPLLISTHGAGVFVEDRHPGLFDVCHDDPGRVVATFSNSHLTFHLLAAPTPLEVLGRYATVAGMPALPPQWAFGVIQWEDEVTGQAQVMEDALAMREHDLPCSGIWVDRPFATAHESFVFDPATYPDAAQMVQDLNGLGYRVAIWSVPYLSEDVAAEYAEAEANGYFVESEDIHFEKFGKLMDLTNPGAVDLWQGLIANATDIGIEGFKLDYAEDVQSGYNYVKFRFKFFNGEGADTMHHWYHYFYHKTYRDMIEGDAFILSRAGCFGDQTITSVCWPGDLCNNFTYHGEDGHVGGLPAAMIGAQTLSVSGYPFFGSDTGGYRHFRPTKEVLLRWVQHTALTTVLQFGGAGANCNPWDFTLYEGEDDGVPYTSQYDEETLAIFRSFAKLHIRLFPYTYTYAVQASQTGIPVLRPFGLVHPELNQHPDFQYFFGDAFTVAPIYRGGESRDFLVPPGRWINWFERTLHEGPAEETAVVALDKLVLLVREGAIVPLLRPDIDTLAPASAPDVVSLVDDPGTLHVAVFPAAEQSTFTSVLGPAFTLAPEAAGGWRLSWQSLTPFTGLRARFDLLHVPDGAPAGVSVAAADGTAWQAAPDEAAVAACTACYFYDADASLLHVSASPDSSALVVKPQ